MLNFIDDFINYLLGTNWVLFSLLFFAIFMIGAFIIANAANCPKGSLSRTIDICAGIFISGLALIFYIDRYIDAFKVIAKWIGIGLAALLLLSLIMVFFIFATERDVNSKKKAKCTGYIAMIISSPKYRDKVLYTGKDLTEKSMIVLYQDDIINPILEDKQNLAKAVNMDKIRLCDRVYVVAKHANLDDYELNNLINYAQSLHKKIIYDIGSTDAYDDDILREALNMNACDIDSTLSKRDYSREAIDHIMTTLDDLKAAATINELKQFADGKISLDYLREKYNF